MKKAKPGEVRKRKKGHYQLQDDGIWKKVFKHNGKWQLATKKKKKKDETDVYTSGLYLVSAYTRRQKGGRLGKFMETMTKEINENGILFSESLESEIVLIRALIAESLEDLEMIEVTDAKKIGQRQWIRSDITEMIQKLSQIMERSVNMKYGKKYSVKMEDVRKIIAIIQNIITRNVDDKETMQKIIKDMYMTLLAPPPPEKVVNGTIINAR